MAFSAQKPQLSFVVTVRENHAKDTCTLHPQCPGHSYAYVPGSLLAGAGAQPAVLAGCCHPALLPALGCTADNGPPYVLYPRDFF